MKLLLNSFAPQDSTIQTIESYCPSIESVTMHSDTVDEFYLTFKKRGLTLVKTDGEPLEVCFDFLSLIRRHLSNRYSLKKEPFAKALGIKGGTELSVLDVTCGTGSDAMLMLAFGARVQGYERNEAIYALLVDALRRANSAPEFEKFRDQFTITLGDPTLLDQSELPDVDTVYLDPMYETGKRKAKQKKEMIMFKELLGRVDNGRELASWAMNVAKKRVVVKRSLRAEKLIEETSAQYCGKSTRYDMYVV